MCNIYIYVYIYTYVYNIYIYILWMLYWNIMCIYMNICKTLAQWHNHGFPIRHGLSGDQTPGSQQVPADSWPCEHESSLDGEGNHIFFWINYFVWRKQHMYHGQQNRKGMTIIRKSRFHASSPKSVLSGSSGSVGLTSFSMDFHVLQMRLENGSGLGRSVDAKFTKGDQGYGRWGPRSRWRMRWVEIWLCLN